MQYPEEHAVGERGVDLVHPQHLRVYALSSLREPYATDACGLKVSVALTWYTRSTCYYMRPYASLKLLVYAALRLLMYAACSN
jgi:hypothetical protein